MDHGGQIRREMTPQDDTVESYIAFRDAVYRYVLILGASPDRAQDVTQEVFLQYYRSVRGDARIEQRKAWLLRVAHNLTINYFVAADRISTGAVVPDVPSSEPTPEARVLQNERSEALHRAVLALSPQQKACLTLRVEGLRYSEIAAVLGISRPSVGEFLRRAVRKLREALRE
jgi:RNA polymerase sigma-70 factor, ECF subfamily